jgi:hypothetical protein
METVSHGLSSVNVHALLRAVGYRNFRGSRADCPHCQGSARLTVAIKRHLFFCHRCHRGGSIRSLARASGINVPPAKVRAADIPKRAFWEWLDRKMTEMADREHELNSKVRHAEQIAGMGRDDEPLWNALIELHNEQPKFDLFWQSCSDKLGRYFLYRAWRRHYAA